ETFILKNGKRKAFHVGSNLSCRQHIRGHYDFYKTKCAELKLPEHHHGIPREIVKANIEAEEKDKRRSADSWRDVSENIGR
ncbi:uncharacterized protein EDB91DRAFT_1047719, partial [Suillus paluster]|uniref:uncharacterized protein n=1 Tax=Suillus paluster TaxID=48578 RepID=UPI001B880CB5